MIILKFFWWAFFIGSAIASIGSFTNEKANSLGRLKNYAGLSFLTIFVITYFIGTFFNFIPGILTILFDLFYWIFTYLAPPALATNLIHFSYPPFPQQHGFYLPYRLGSPMLGH